MTIPAWVLRMREAIRPYEHRIPAIALLAGLVWDSLTLTSPDRVFDNVVLVTYLILSAGGIMLLNIRQGTATIGPLPLIGLIQFSFGNLASGILVLYARSGTFGGSLLFLVLLGALLLGNEFLRSHYERAHFHVTVWYVLLFAYLGLVVPVLVGSIGALVFLLSGAVSVVIVAGMLFALYKVAGYSVKKGFDRIVLSVSAAFFIFTACYFLNIIPPVPLALKHIGVYHSVEKLSDGNYTVSYEHKRWWEYFQDTSSTFHMGTGESAACFSSVFAPNGLSSPVYHRWEFWNPESEAWETELRILFPINGGRAEGYRGYTQKTRLWPGKWRCNVETQRGALIGRVTFDIIEVPTPPPLLERFL